MEIEDYKEGLNYSEDVWNAVRYGYLYRVEAERQEDSSIHYSLTGVSEILLWLCENILNDLAWNGFKVLAKKTYCHLIELGSSLSAELKALFTEERELKRFYTYVKEFNENSMTATEKQLKYIREEIIADYHGKEIARIFNQEKREPTHDDYLRIVKEAEEYADKLMKLKDSI